MPRIHSSKGWVSSITDIEEVDIHLQKNKIEHNPIIYTPNKLKWDYGLKLRPKTIKFLEENVSENLYSICLSNGFLERTLKALAVKANTDK